jgi:senataxin
MTCFSKGKNSPAPAPSYLQNMISSYNLNDSQEAAVFSCIAMRDCNHQNPVNLIWGPPGTGKTKTVGVLLHALLKMKCRTLTCAPTNIAVMEVTTRLLRLVRESLDHDMYGLGDIVLFGNGKRMKIYDRFSHPKKKKKIAYRKDLLDIFLDYRVDALKKCVAPKSGWRNGLESMISLLDDPKSQYEIYLEKRKQEKLEEEKRKAERREEEKRKEEKRRKKKRKEKKKEEKIKKENNEGDDELKKDDPLTYEEFVKKTFCSIHEQLKFCMVSLNTHLPTSLLPLEVVKNMRRALTLLKSLETLLCGVSVANEGLLQVLNNFEDIGSSVGCLAKSSMRGKCLLVLKYLKLSLTSSVPDLGNRSIENFCLENAILLFCTASSSAKLHRTEASMEFLVIDEAAQLKECESAIPLQLDGVRHAILIGDERQLPAMVKSEVRVLSLGSFVFKNYEHLPLCLTSFECALLRYPRRLNLEEVCLKDWSSWGDRSTCLISSIGCIRPSAYFQTGSSTTNRYQML